MAYHIKTYLHGLLRRSERYTKTDMVYLFKGGAWSTGGSIVSTLIAAVTVVAFANLLPKEAYGTYQYILSTVDLFGVFVLAGVDVALGRSVARGMDGSWRDAVRIKIRWGMVGAAGSLALGAYYLIHHNALLGWAFIIASVAIPFWETGGIYATYLQGKKRFDLMNLGDVATQLVSTAFIVPALFLTDNILVLLTLYLASNGIMRGIFLWFSLRKEPPNSAHDPNMIAYGTRLTLVSAMSNIASSADKIIVWQLLGPASVAIYTFAQAMPLRAIGFLKIINRLAFPKMAAQEHETLQHTLLRKVWGMVGIGVVGTVAYALAAPFIFAIFFPQYMQAVPYTIAAGILLALQPFSLISSAFTAQAKQREIFIWSVATPITRLALFFVLIPLFGLWGAVWTLVMAKAFESLLLVYLFYRR